MKRSLSRVSCLLLLVLFAAGFVWAGEADVVKSVLEGRAAVKPFPNPSSELPGLTVDKAYALQKEVVKGVLAKGDAVSGFKGGLTAEAGQKRFGVSGPVMAPLFKSGELSPGAAVNSKDFVKLFIETEIGYVFGQKISEPVKDVDYLKKTIKEVFPAVELPDLRFANMKTVNGPDIIVDAVSAAKYIVGKKIPADKVDVNTIEVTLTLDGNMVNQGKAADALGDQWKALLWIVNSALAQGWTIEPGQVIITGAMGAMLPGKPGKYEGKWGPLGTISWTVN